MDLEQILQKTRGTSMGSGLLEYLIRSSMMPKISADFPSPGATGDYTYDGLSDPGSIRLHPYKAGLATLIHELTHSAEKQMINQYYKTTGSKQNDQFTNAYEKLWHGGSKFQNQQKNYGPSYLPNILGGQWNFDNADYRSSPEEVNAHATANQFRRYDPDFAAPPHMDTTLATEFEIMLDLARRNLKRK